VLSSCANILPTLLPPALLCLPPTAEPALSPDIAAASHHARLFPLEGWCDPGEATRSFLQDAQQLGAQVLFEHKVGLQGFWSLFLCELNMNQV
jgi:hypothetical protein